MGEHKLKKDGPVKIKEKIPVIEPPKPKEPANPVVELISYGADTAGRRFKEVAIKSNMFDKITVRAFVCENDESKVIPGIHSILAKEKEGRFIIYGNVDDHHGVVLAHLGQMGKFLDPNQVVQAEALLAADYTVLEFREVFETDAIIEALRKEGICIDKELVWVK